jgi:molybdopterin synthase sulfur carrier subunit
MADLLFFGRLRDAVGASALRLDLPAHVSDTQSLRAWLADRHPDLSDPLVRIAVNAELQPEGAPISATDEIAFLPPMSGG